jgi:hypothetical protein
VELGVLPHGRQWGCICFPPLINSPCCWLRSAIHFVSELSRYGGQVEALIRMTWNGLNWDLFTPPQVLCANCHAEVHNPHLKR